MQRPQSSIIILIIIMAIILAAGSFLALSYIQRRPESPEGTIPVVVEGQEVIVSTDPAQAVRIISPEEVPAAPQPEGEGEAQPAEPTPEQAQQQEPTPLPEVVAASPTPPPPPPTAVPNPVIFVDYVVQQSDTLYNVTRQHTTSIALMAQYGISQDDMTPGNVIRVPVGNPNYCPGRRPYAVREGETAFTIAKKFGTTAEDLRNINGLDANYTVYAAQILCVP